jgi:hypothetical protein
MRISALHFYRPPLVSRTELAYCAAAESFLDEPVAMGEAAMGHEPPPRAGVEGAAAERGRASSPPPPPPPLPPPSPPMLPPSPGTRRLLAMALPGRCGV